MTSEDDKRRQAAAIRKAQDALNQPNVIAAMGVLKQFQSILGNNNPAPVMQAGMPSQPVLQVDLGELVNAMDMIVVKLCDIANKIDGLNGMLMDINATLTYK